MAVAEQQLEIDAPERMTRRERTRDALLTAALWAFYFYLWVPLASLLAWLVGIELAYGVLVRAGGVHGLGAALKAYGLAIMLIFAAVTAWSLSNRLRFSGRRNQRRQRAASVGDDELVSYFEVTPTQLERLRTGTRIEIAFLDAGGGETTIALASGRPRSARE